MFSFTQMLGNPFKDLNLPFVDYTLNLRDLNLPFNFSCSLVSHHALRAYHLGVGSGLDVAHRHLLCPNCAAD